ncbi:MAG: hypothetical protein OWQ59_10480 [Alicyclobacillaceae bacterium]|jgi:hypothetical protein|nr:hypothetical protein [Alicyclobacillaceae bacterium]
MLERTSWTAEWTPTEQLRLPSGQTITYWHRIEGTSWQEVLSQLCHLILDVDRNESDW